MADVTVTFSDAEMSIMLSCVGALLASMATDVPSGQPAPPQMIDMLALQAKLMKANGQ